MNVIEFNAVLCGRNIYAGKCRGLIVTYGVSHGGEKSGWLVTTACVDQFDAVDSDFSMLKDSSGTKQFKLRHAVEWVDSDASDFEVPQELVDFVGDEYGEIVRSEIKHSIRSCLSFELATQGYYRGW